MVSITTRKGLVLLVPSCTEPPVPPVPPLPPSTAEAPKLYCEGDSVMLAAIELPPWPPPPPMDWALRPRAMTPLVLILSRLSAAGPSTTTAPAAWPSPPLPPMPRLRLPVYDSSPLEAEADSDWVEPPAPPPPPTDCASRPVA